MGDFENDYSFLLQRLQVDNCDFELGHWLFDGMVVMVSWDVLRVIIASDWIVANFPNQSTSFPTFLHSFRSSSWDGIFLLKEASFQTEKDLVLFDVRQFMVPFVTRLSQNCQAFQHDEVERMPFFTLFSRNGWEESYFLIIRIFYSWWHLMVHGDSGKHSAINFVLVVFILSEIDHGPLSLI